MTPAYITVTPGFGTGIIAGLVASTTDLIEQYKFKNFQVQLNTSQITGAGTYTIVGDDVLTQPAAILYSPGTEAAGAGTGKVFTSTGGSVMLSAWDTAIGGHITGSFTANMATDDTPPTTGTMGATFDFIVGSSNAL